MSRQAGLALLVLLSAAAQAPDRSSLVDCLARKPRARWLLPPDLREISGLTFTSDGRLLAHDDERARVVELDYRSGREVKAFRLGSITPRRDFEAIAVAADRVFLVTSEGVLYQAREGRDGQAVPFAVTRTGAGARCEVEGLAYEPRDKALLFLCKTARVRGLLRTITILRWSLEGERWLVPERLMIPLDARFRRSYGNEFRGSDLARDPVTGRYLAIAGLNRVAVELTPEGRLVGAGFLGKHHPQAEGVAVARDGTIVVSDEGGHGPAHLTVYDCAR
ncbi:MAG TPA: hypothetical protein VGQ17_08600 [Gemmatimonadales bacterium]|nr:hypothetical protein [Gemmatimonadales bacterium]